MFDAEGRLDEEAQAAHLDRLIRDGAHGVVVGGTSGEFVGLTDRERRRLVARRRGGGRADAYRVIAGTGWYSTAETIALTRDAADAGADGAIVILPYYQKPTVAEVMEHFRAVGPWLAAPGHDLQQPGQLGRAAARGLAQLGELYADGYAQAVKSTFPDGPPGPRGPRRDGRRLPRLLRQLHGAARRHGRRRARLDQRHPERGDSRRGDAVERDAGVRPRRGSRGLGADPADQVPLHEAAAGPGQRPRDLPGDAAAARPGRRLLPRAAAGPRARTRSIDSAPSSRPIDAVPVA